MIGWNVSTSVFNADFKTNAIRIIAESIIRDWAKNITTVMTSTHL